MSEIPDLEAQLDQFDTLTWSEKFTFLEQWLDRHYAVSIFGNASGLLYGDGSGVDTMNGYGPAAVRALRLAVDLSRQKDTLHGSR